jgi:peptidoglycan/xylan/chitin deacetylase (PgdA/CDA1 family)
VKPGSIVLMHDGGGDRKQTIDALPNTIKQLKAMGYTFVTLDQMYPLG